MIQQPILFSKELKTLEVTSEAFNNRTYIPTKYTCDGENINPPLNIQNIPLEAKSLVLVVDDPDALAGTWVHWIVWNILPASKIKEKSVPGIEGINDFRKQKNVKAWLILGHLAVAYSGDIKPDAHPEHQGAWPADVFYADMDGEWTDTSVTSINGTYAANHNIPGDGKLEQSYITYALKFQIRRMFFSSFPPFYFSYFPLHFLVLCYVIIISLLF